ncbi:unnamed protein product [Discosporangium mesarthrocarpum]
MSAQCPHPKSLTRPRRKCDPRERQGIKGGAILATGDSARVRFEDDAKFRDINGAIRGGAIAILESPTAQFKRRVDFKGD